MEGLDIKCGKVSFHCGTVYDMLDKLCRVPEQLISDPVRMPISVIFMNRATAMCTQVASSRMW